MTKDTLRSLQRLCGAKMRSAMDLRGLTVDDLVRETGVSRSTIYDFLAGNGKPRLTLVLELAAALDVSTRALVPTLDEMRAILEVEG